jgi:hypothetical protein
MWYFELVGRNNDVVSGRRHDRDKQANGDLDCFASAWLVPVWRKFGTTGRQPHRASRAAAKGEIVVPGHHRSGTD